MRKFIILCLLALSFSAQASELPRQIVLKTTTQSFTHEYDVAIHDGKIWYRPRVLNTMAGPMTSTLISSPTTSLFARSSCTGLIILILIFLFRSRPFKNRTRPSPE